MTINRILAPIFVCAALAAVSVQAKEAPENFVAECKTFMTESGGDPAACDCLDKIASDEAKASIAAAKSEDEMSDDAKAAWAQCVKQ